MKTILYICTTEAEAVKVFKKCIKSNISFEFMNGNEVYFSIYDEIDFEFKQAVLGTEIINYKNIVN
jgi:hypothetical protein